MSIVHWVAVLLVVVLVFGTKKLGNIGADLGKAVRGFKDGVKGDDAAHGDAAVNVNPVGTASANSTAAQIADKTIIDIEAKERSVDKVDISA